MANISKAVGQLKKELEFIASQAFMAMLAMKARDILYKRVKSGYGVSSPDSKSPSKQRLEPLSKQYVQYRKGIVSFKTKEGKSVNFKVKAPTLGPFGAPGRSNLTLSGFLLENIKFRATKSKFVIYFPNQKHPQSSLTLTQLVQTLEDQGRPFFNFTQDEQRILLKEIENEIRKAARRF